jgi:hypothetical protein
MVEKELNVVVIEKEVRHGEAPGELRARHNRRNFAVIG